MSGTQLRIVAKRLRLVVGAGICRAESEVDDVMGTVLELYIVPFPIVELG
jgi:hypothetical protein